MFANYGTCAEDSRCASSGHFIPHHPLSKGHGSGHRRCVFCLYRMASQCTIFHVPGGKKFSTLAILCLFTMIYSNNMDLYSAKMKKFSCGHPQRLPLLYVVYEYTHVVKPDILFRMLFWLSSFPSIA